MEPKTTTKRINLTKWRLLWILIAAAWLFVFLKLLVGALFEKNTSLVAAFSVTNPQEISATVEVTARYPEGTLENAQRENLIQELANAIHLKVDGALEVVETPQRKETVFAKNAKVAETELKVISLSKSGMPDGNTNVVETAGNGLGVTVLPEANHYLYAKICLNDSIETILSYKELLQEALEELACTEISTTLQLVGDYAGYLPLERRNEITEEILEALGAQVVYEYREHELYTVYAYTASLDNYITVEGKKINLHIAMSQNEDHYRTTLYLASPILPDTW